MQSIFLMNVDEIVNKDIVGSFLPDSVTARIKRLKEDADVRRSLCGALLIETFTANVPLLYGENGKPYKEKPPFFNVSHSGNKAGIFLNDGADVGFDIETVKYHDPKLIEYAFGIEERSGVKDETDFAVRWTMKEAAAKCVGNGIFPLKKREMCDISENCFYFGGKKLYYKTFIMQPYVFTACSYEHINAKVETTTCEKVLKMLANKRDNGI